VALPFVAADDGVPPDEPVECFSAGAVVMRGRPATSSRSRSTGLAIGDALSIRAFGEVSRGEGRTRTCGAIRRLIFGQLMHRQHQLRAIAVTQNDTPDRTAVNQPEERRPKILILFDEMVPRGGLSLDPVNRSKINYLTPPRILALYQAIVSMSTVK
jgi:hypothetical protein